jgi:urease accessory protein
MDGGPMPESRATDLALLRLLQLADSGFPSGAYTVSNGLETLVAHGTIRSADQLAGFVRVQLRSRFARSDLIALLAAHAASAEPGEAEPAGAVFDRIVAIDGRLTATKIAADDRLASARVGRRLATEVAALVPAASVLGFIDAIQAGRTAGNAAVALGLAGRALGVDARRTALAAASSLVIGLGAAAVRLGFIGHGAAQRLVAGAAPEILAAVDSAEQGHWKHLRPSAPQIDVALAAHETALTRQFVS